MENFLLETAAPVLLGVTSLGISSFVTISRIDKRLSKQANNLFFCAIPIFIYAAFRLYFFLLFRLTSIGKFSQLRPIVCKFLLAVESFPSVDDCRTFTLVNESLLTSSTYQRGSLSLLVSSQRFAWSLQFFHQSGHLSNNCTTRWDKNHHSLCNFIRNDSSRVLRRALPQHNYFGESVNGFHAMKCDENDRNLFLRVIIDR